MPDVLMSFLISFSHYLIWPKPHICHLKKCEILYLTSNGHKGGTRAPMCPWAPRQAAQCAKAPPNRDSVVVLAFGPLNKTHPAAGWVRAAETGIARQYLHAQPCATLNSMTKATHESSSTCLTLHSSSSYVSLVSGQGMILKQETAWPSLPP